MQNKLVSKWHQGTFLDTTSTWNTKVIYGRKAYWRCRTGWCEPNHSFSRHKQKGLLKKTIDKVHAAMQELNYKPNNLARGLQGKSAKLVGLIFPNISNVFYAELIERLEDELFKQGYKTIICNSEHDPTRKKDYLRCLPPINVMASSAQPQSWHWGL